MTVIVLILLLVAAAAGVLGAVLKATLILVLSLILSIVVLGALAAWYARRRLRAFQRDMEVRVEHARRRRQAVDVSGGASRDTQRPPLHPRP